MIVYLVWVEEAYECRRLYNIYLKKEDAEKVLIRHARARKYFFEMEEREVVV